MLDVMGRLLVQLSGLVPRLGLSAMPWTSSCPWSARGWLTLKSKPWALLSLLLCLWASWRAGWHRRKHSFPTGNNEVTLVSLFYSHLSILCRHKGVSLTRLPAYVFLWSTASCKPYWGYSSLERTRASPWIECQSIKGHKAGDLKTPNTPTVWITGEDPHEAEHANSAHAEHGIRAHNQRGHFFKKLLQALLAFPPPSLSLTPSFLFRQETWAVRSPSYPGSREPKLKQRSSSPYVQTDGGNVPPAGPGLTVMRNVSHACVW